MQIYFAFWGELGAFLLGFCTDKTKSPAPNGAGDFYRLIVGLVRCTLGSSVADLHAVR
jgi:hypothetical protein